MTRLRIPTLLFLLAAPALLAQGVDRSHPPQPGPVRPFHLPPLRTFTLSNGLAVTLVEKHQVPVASLLLAVRAGASSDPDGKPGLAVATAEMLDEGAGGKDALALDDAISFLGAELGTGAAWDASTVQLHVPVARLEAALGLMADVALRPDFPEKEWARLRKEKLTEFLQARAEPGLLARTALARAVFGPKHRYGTPVGGNAAAVAAFTPGEMRAFHAARYRPADAALFVAGDVTVERMKPLLEAAFGRWTGGPAAAVPLAEPPQVFGRRIWIVDKPGAAQSTIRVARVGPNRRTPDWAVLQVANTLLGGSFTSRLNDNLREKHGWSYGAGSSFDARRTAGLFGAGADVQTPATADALREFLKELEGIGRPATEEEVSRARSFLALRWAEQFETTGQLTSKLAETFVQGFPPSELETFVPAALAVTPAQLAEASRKRIDPRALAIIIVGDRAKVEKPVRELKAGEVRVVGVDEILGPAPKVE